MFDTIYRAYSLFSKRERRQALFLFACILLMAVVETVGVASIMPFMALVSNPDAIESSNVLGFLYQALGFTQHRQFLIFVGIAVLGIMVVGNTLSALTTWLLLHFTQLRAHTLSTRLLAGYLAQPYAYFLGANTADLGKNILNEVNSVLNGVLVPGMQLLARGTVAVFILLMLLVVDPVISILTAVIVGGSYFLVYKSVNTLLTRLGKEAVAASAERFRIAGEAMGGIKELKLLGREQEFVRRYSVPSLVMADRLALSRTIGQVPRYALETVAFGGILMLTLVLLGGEKTIVGMLPMLALYAFAGYRLMPALQQVFASVTSIRYSAPALDVLYEDLRSVPAPLEGSSEEGHLPFERKIDLLNINFRYPGTEKDILHDLTLEIPKNTTIGFVGSTGAGKTTLIDILLGLLAPTSGTLALDGIAITPGNIRRWQSMIGYVPQQIYLSDDTVAGNIAFGFDPKDINRSRVEVAARLANIHDFVVGLPQGYDTEVGERGVRLSGGQRQRIGIARALYHEPSVLVFDEATSALDGITEQAIIEAIEGLSRRKTIVMIAHRLSTLRSCDRIFILDSGRVVAQGTYEQLYQSNDQFRRMAESR